MSFKKRRRTDIKKISDLSMDEFKKVFPIIVKEHNPDYKKWYENETQNIMAVVRPDDIVRINHIGSTAIEGLLAKPTIDILLEIDGGCLVSKLVENLKTIGYGIEIFERSDDPFRLLLGKGYSVDGYAEKVFHLHVRYFGDWNELYFRDYLLAHPETAAEYGKLKLGILDGIEKGVIERIPNGKRVGYSAAKEDFVTRHTSRAKTEFQGRYSWK